MARLLGMPGIGGSLGQCALCGKTFTTQILMSMSGFNDEDQRVHTGHLEGFDEDLCFHQKCKEQLEKLNGGSWEALPDGPIRKAFAEAAARQPAEGDGEQR